MATTPPATTVKKATMINPVTGKKLVVVAGSQQSHEAFGQGYYLMGKDGKAVGYTPPPAANNNSSTNASINANQTADQTAASDNPPTATDRLATATANFFDHPATAPTIPSLVDTFNTERTSLGIPDLESSLNHIKDQQRLLTQNQKARNTFVEGKQIALGAISGQESEIDRQTRVQMDSLSVQAQAITDELTVKYNVVNTITNLTGQDYNNARAAYDADFTHAIDSINLLRGLSNDEKTDDQRKIDNARANLTVITNAITNGNIDYKDLPNSTKTTITGLELAAGLPAGFTAKLRSTNPNSEIISSTEREDASHNKYIDMVVRDRKTGKITVQHVLAGKVYHAPTAVTPPSDTQLLAQQVSKFGQQMAAKAGGDGYLSPQDYKAARSNWIKEGYSSTTFDDNFAGYVNPSHWKDYLAAKPQAEQINPMTGKPYGQG